MYVGSDVSLAEYLCTHVAIIYIFTEDAATPSDGFYVDVDINVRSWVMDACPCKSVPLWVYD